MRASPGLVRLKPDATGKRLVRLKPDATGRTSSGPARRTPSDVEGASRHGPAGEKVSGGRGRPAGRRRGARAGRVRQPLPVPDLPGFRTLKGDFHLHTVFSDGNVWPTVHVQEAWRDGLDVIALTEHAEYHPHTADVKVDDARSHRDCQAARGSARHDPGAGGRNHQARPADAARPARGSQHFNALFVTDPKVLNVPNDLMEALRRAKAQSAFVFWNHPATGYHARGGSRPWIGRATTAGLSRAWSWSTDRTSTTRRIPGLPSAS